MVRWLVCVFFSVLGQGALASVLYCEFDRSYLTGHVFPQAMQLHLGPGPEQVVAHLHLEDGLGAMVGQIEKSTTYKQVFTFHVDGLRDGANRQHRITYQMTYRRMPKTFRVKATVFGSKQLFRATGHCIG